MQNKQQNNETEQLPLYLLNTFVYCPRRFYYEYVDGIFITNDDVAEGTSKHVRVDDGEGKAPQEVELAKGVVNQYLGVYLGDDKLNIVGKLDMMEETATHTYPVEYKKKAAPSNANGDYYVWDSDQIQITAQAFLMEANGYPKVPYGYLYYIGSKVRVKLDITDELRERTRDTIDKARELSKQNVIPEPTKDTHKCGRCSLEPICMPNETLRLSRVKLIDTSKIIPSNDLTDVVYVNTQAATISKSGEQLIIKSKDGNIIAEQPMATVSSIVLMGHVNMTTQARDACAYDDIPVISMSLNGNFKSISTGLPHKNVSLRLAQYNTAQDDKKRLKIAREIVSSKIHNQRVLLKRNSNAESVSEIKFKQLKKLIDKSTKADEIDSLLGLEGLAANIYFGKFSTMLKPNDMGGFDFKTRNRRPPRDPVNALISLCYSLLMKDCISACMTVGFDPYIGVYHVAKYGRPALALDLMEEFRPILADSTVINVINNKIIDIGDFAIAKQACYLKEAGRAKLFEAYERRKNTEIIHPLFKYKVTYRRIIEVQARLIARVMQGELKEYAGFRVR